MDGGICLLSRAEELKSGEGVPTYRRRYSSYGRIHQYFGMLKVSQNWKGGERERGGEGLAEGEQQRFM